ncbi:hypothetical protein EZV62_024532 [Acer yangbiense]|uniref:ATP-dependent DNA helicase n=1 Tax=Acer yangbiense TaxID=1000413 RepID=A0A5C7GVY7_9ROSI|nr:hypothetical protein EZV62_024532 [Acer yangbiense]
MVLEENAIQTSRNGSEQEMEIDEIKSFLDCRYLSTCDACWRIFEFDIQYRSLGVQRLIFHLPEENVVTYRDSDYLNNVVNRLDVQTTMFTKWMEANVKYEDARELSYADFPTKWSFEEIRTVNGVAYETYKATCYALGLLYEDKEWHEAIIQASQWTLNFPQLTLTETQLKNLALYEIKQILQKNNRSLKDFPPLPLPNHSLIQDANNRLIREELSYDIQRLIMEHKELYSGLNVQQMNVHDIVVQSVIENKGGLYFVYGAGGTGKTYLYKTILSRLRSEGKICFAVASSGIASLLLPGGKLHIQGDGKLPTVSLEGEEDSCWIVIPDDLLIPNSADPIASIVSREIATYLSSDSICKASGKVFDQDMMFPIEFLNSLKFPGLPNHDYLSNIKKGKDDWRITVRISRKWESRNFHSNEFYSLDMLLLDEQGAHVHASIQNFLIPKFTKLVDEGKVYTIQNFKVVDNNGNCKPVSHQYKLLLLPTTTINELRGDHSSIPNHQFEFQDFENLERRVDDNNLLTDVVGNLIAMSTVENQQVRGSSSTCKKWILQIKDISIPNINEKVEQLPTQELHKGNEATSLTLAKTIKEILLMTTNSESEVITVTCEAKIIGIDSKYGWKVFEDED